MQVDGVKPDLRLRVHGAHSRDVLNRNVVATERNHIILITVLLKMLLYRLAIRRMEDLDAFLRQLCSVGFRAIEVVCDEGHLATHLHEDSEQPDGAQRPRILIGRQHAGLNPQNAGARTPVALEHGVHTVCAMTIENSCPLLGKARLVRYLMRLHAGTRIRAVGDTLQVSHDCLRLIHHLATCSTHGETEVSVFVVSGRKRVVKASDLLPQRALDHQRCCRPIVHLSRVAEARIFRVLTAPPVPGGAIPPDDATGLLK